MTRTAWPALLLGVVGVVAALPATAGHPGVFPPPKTLGPVATYGTNVQRSMTLMATSTPLRRNTVRVLFYGQSITQQDWALAVAECLRRKYPLADLVIENRAIGGFHARLLSKTAEADLYPFYPDLVILHDYVHDGTDHYEDIVRSLRQRTTADVLHANDHISTQLGERVDEETSPAKLARADGQAWLNNVFLPDVARRYGTEFVDLRRVWKRYLADYDLPPSSLLVDDIHLNDRGCRLMAQAIASHLRYRPELPDAGWKDRVRTLAVGSDVKWKGGKLAVPFEGNRIDLLCTEGTAPPAPVRIDGKRPSEFPELYAATRSYGVSPRCPFPPILRVRAATLRVIEDWALTVTHVSRDRQYFRFKVAGTVTGEDGEGDSRSRFVSKSGRVVIEPEDVHLGVALKLSRDPQANPFVARWSVVPLFADEFVAPARRNRFGETFVTVAQGLPNGPHTLEVTGGPDTPIEAVRVYRPPLPAQQTIDAGGGRVTPRALPTGAP